MEKTIMKKYVTFPVSSQAGMKKVLFYLNGQLVYDLDVRLADHDSDYTAFVDVSRFTGETLSIVCEPDMPLAPGEAEEKALPGLYRENTRPLVHFTVKNGWNNDPNGLVFHNGTYHMFFQYNPCEAQWGNMHWGHAVSRDLVHWQETDVALFPNEYGTVFSGSAVTDDHNLSGLGTAEHPPVLLYYTAAGGSNRMSAGKAFTQRLSYSTDDGVTFTDYPDAIVEHIAAANRDPKVVFADELGCYVMALYLDGNEFELLSSRDLLHWDFLQKISIEGDAECPNFVKVPVVSGGVVEEYRWVLFGAKGIYLVGRFIGGRFVPEQPEARQNSATASYAGQCFAGLSDGQVIQIDWVRATFGTARFSQAMSLPNTLVLERSDDRLILKREPIRAVACLRNGEQRFAGVIPTTPLALDGAPGAHDIVLEMPYDEGNRVTLTVGGQTVGINMSANTVNIGQNGCTLSRDKARVSLRIIVDRGVAEVYADNGRFWFTSALAPDKTETDVVIKADRPIADAAVTVYGLSSVWA